MSDPVEGNGLAGASLPKKKRNKAWIWYFVVLAVLTVVATGVLIAFNLRQQLKPGQLEAAQKLWEQKGPANYLLVYRVRRADGADDEIAVRVRGGKVESVTDNGRPLEAGKFKYYGMPALFENLDAFLDEATKPNKPRTYMRASFDPEDGHLRHFVRRVMGVQPVQRVEIEVERFVPLP